MFMRKPAEALVLTAVPALARDAIAVARLTRLVTSDDITEPLREGWIGWAYGHRVPLHLLDAFGPEPVSWIEVYEADIDPPKLATVIMCRWCASIWLAFGVLAVRRSRPWGALADALCMSEAAALAERLEGH